MVPETGNARATASSRTATNLQTNVDPQATANHCNPQCQTQVSTVLPSFAVLDASLVRLPSYIPQETTGEPRATVIPCHPQAQVNMVLPSFAVLDAGLAQLPGHIPHETTTESQATTNHYNPQGVLPSFAELSANLAPEA